MKKVSLNELMGKAGASRKLSLDQLGEILGEKMPEISYTPVGRYRLMNALRNRFGDEYRNIPGVKDIMKEFDDHASFNVRLQEMKMIGKKR